MNQDPVQSSQLKGDKKPFRLSPFTVHLLSAVCALIAFVFMISYGNYFLGRILGLPVILLSMYVIPLGVGMLVYWLVWKSLSGTKLINSQIAEPVKPTNVKALFYSIVVGIVGGIISFFLLVFLFAGIFFRGNNNSVNPAGLIFVVLIPVMIGVAFVIAVAVGIILYEKWK